MNEAERIHQKGVATIKKGKRFSPLKAIRLNCLNCSGWQKSEVRKCVIKDCILYQFRFGRNMTGRKSS